jgi:hypothetical protein
MPDSKPPPLSEKKPETSSLTSSTPPSVMIDDATRRCARPRPCPAGSGSNWLIGMPHGKPTGKLRSMGAMTTMKLSVDVRDRLMALATAHGRTLGAELAALVDEAEERDWWRNAQQAAARLQADVEQWADYLREADDWNATVADGLGDHAAEWPEPGPSEPPSAQQLVSPA